jgi:hypothetical protein
MHFSTFVSGLTVLALSSSATASTLGRRQQTEIRYINGRTCQIQYGVDRLGGDYARTKYDSFEDCISACAADTNCKSAQYHLDNQYCYFKNSVNPAVSDANENSVDCSGQITINGRQCQIQYGIDRAGGDYDRQNTGTFEGCQQACSSDPICVTAQYHINSGWCYLKNSLNAGFQSSNDNSIDCNTDVVINGRQCHIQPGVDRFGGDYDRSRTGSFSGCVSACAADPQCVTAQYHEGNQYCYFKNVANSPVMASDHDTIDCDATPVTPDAASETP